MKIYLIRHGESISDIKEKYDGDYDDSLTEKGFQEAEVIAEKLIKSGVEIVFSSPKIRAKDTAKIICAKLGCEILTKDDLAEQDIYGAYPELSKDQPEEEYRRLGEVLAKRDNVIEGVETYKHFKDRVTNCFSDIINDNKYKIVAIVTPGGPIRCIFREILNLGEFKKISNGAIIELDKNIANTEVVKFDGASLK